MTLYVTLSQLKTLINETSTARDDQLTEVVTAASGSVDEFCSRVFGLDASASARVFTPRGATWADPEGDHLLVDDIGSLTGLTVEVGTSASWSALNAATWEAEPLEALTKGRPVTSLLRIAGQWPSSPGQRIRVTARWGWPAVPPPVDEAARRMALRLWKLKDAPEGVVGSAEWGAVRVLGSDPVITGLLAPFVRPGMA